MRLYQNTFRVYVRTKNAGGTTSATLSYNPADPYAVTLYIGDRIWIFGRELFAGGGFGDVKVFRNEDAVAVILMDECHIIFSKAELNSWLFGTHSLVPIGQESEFINMDEIINRLLDNPPN